MWRENWEEFSGGQRRGAQGAVSSVAGIANRVRGALKQMHQAHLMNTERRYRMQQEVNALLALNGHHVPRALDSNVERWRDAGTPLFLVMEWIDGPTLSQLVSGHPIPLDKALKIVRVLLSAVSKCHDLGIFHRDLKPDNIIIRENDDPVIVDFGMSWTRPDPEEDREFETEVDQELGNRFFRLPEHAPNRHVYDPRSDITMVIGLLFYMLSGRAPRVLKDAHGSMPHNAERDLFPIETTSDPRWPRMVRIFNVGFQERIDARFGTTQEVLDRLDNLAPSADADMNDELEEELARVNDLLSSNARRELAELQREMTEASRDFLNSLSARLGHIKFSYGGGGPNVENGVCVMNFFILQSNTTEPKASFHHTISIENNMFVASVQVEGSNARIYYTGTSSDTAGLRESVKAEAVAVLTQLLRVYRSKIDHHS